MPSGVTEIVAGKKTDPRDFLLFHVSRIVSSLLWRETSQRLGKAGQLKRGDSERDPWLLDVTVDRFRRAERFVNDEVGSKPASVLRIWPVGGWFIIKFE